MYPRDHAGRRSDVQELLGGQAMTRLLAQERERVVRLVANLPDANDDETSPERK
jgi:hypothetical protein